jgi:hypothetical protein
MICVASATSHNVSETGLLFKNFRKAILPQLDFSNKKPHSP